MAKKISHAQLMDWLASFVAEGKLFGPVKNSHRWQKLDNANDIGCAFETVLSPKDIFFPQDQTMFDFDLRKPMETLSDATPEISDGAVLVGLHPCDARALELINRVYNEGDYKDAYFNAAWNKIVRVAVGCTNPPKTCFCTSLVGGSPFGTQGVDILATPTGENWILEPITPRGTAIVAQFADASASDMDMLAMAKKEATGKVDSSVPTEIADNMWDLFNKDEFWFDIGNRCLGCGICTFVCPSCYCFDINDEHIDEKARRYRTWDTCQFRQFTLEASGHNPRGTQKERIRQRMMHKLSFFARRYDNTQLCVGCGRCVRECPVNIDIRAIAHGAGEELGVRK